MLQLWGFGTDLQVCGQTIVSSEACVEPDPLEEEDESLETTKPWSECPKSSPPFFKYIPDGEMKGTVEVATDDEQYGGRHSFRLVYSLKKYPRVIRRGGF